MPRHTIEDAVVTVNGVTVSGRVKKISFSVAKRAPAIVTAMTDAWEENVLVDIKGFKSSIEFFQDYSSGSAYATIKGVFDSAASSGVTVTAQPTTAIRSSDNPQFSGSVLLDGAFPLIDAEVGGVNMMPVSFLGTGALSFLTSSS